MTNAESKDKELERIHNMTDYRGMMARIATAQSLGDTERLSRSLDRHYYAGQLTTWEISRLHMALRNKTVVIDNCI